MRYYSLEHKTAEVSFREAALRGIAPDRGLYFPGHIPIFPMTFWESLAERDFLEIAFELMSPYTGDSLPEDVLGNILQETLSFDFPLLWLDDRMAVLELFHGPTMAFKDVGAGFMAGCLGYFSQASDVKTTVLVATSGDTGGAVARGFLGVSGVEVVILYPEGMVSDIQERQLTSLGENIRALRVAGTFDDCQRMVKRAFLDPVLQEKQNLTSANSINVARWLPQMLYYVKGFQLWGLHRKAPIFSVPSGNFGNICAGMLAAQMGLPVTHFVAATNINDTVPRYMEGKNYEPKPTVATLSNAMDVADPSNFIRIRELFRDRFPTLASSLSAFAYDDTKTLEAIKSLYQSYRYVADPHGAIGYLGLKQFLESSPDHQGIFLETAHPIKFREAVENCLGISLEVPDQIRDLLHRQKKYTPIRTYEELRENLL